MKLLEAATPGSAKPPRELIRWFENVIKGDYTIDENGGVAVQGDVVMTNRNHTEIPVQFTEISGVFNCARNNLELLKGAPHTVGGSFTCSENKLQSLHFAPQKVGDHFIASRNSDLTSLHNIHKKIRQCPILVFESCFNLKSAVLGVLLIKGLLRVEFDNRSLTNIINKHLASGRDIHECQEELIDAGFDDYAQL